MKVEDKVKKIVETSSTLSIREKSDIICLIECYKQVDNLTKFCMEKIVDTITTLESLRKEFIYEPFEGSTKIVDDLTDIIDNLKKGLL